MNTRENATLEGLHHVTAIASDPQRNLDFYAGVLGLRLVKRTINFDDPGTYHFYFGDGQGTPGTILTFFPHPGAGRGQRGTGQTTAVAYAVAPDSLDYWRSRLAAHDIAAQELSPRFGENGLTFADPDAMQIELIATPDAPAAVAWTGSDVPAEHALRGFHSVTLTERDLERTAKLLTGTMGFQQAGQEADRTRYEIGSGGAGTFVDIVASPNGRAGCSGAGSIHHIAFRTPDDAQQIAWRDELTRQQYGVSPVMDRDYFHSIYFREPGGVLFEIATDPPGFTVDEPLAELGRSLKLPPWLEARRRDVEQILPPITLPASK